MTKHLLLLCFTISTLIANSATINKDELEQLYSLTKTDLDSAYSLSYEFLSSSESEDDYFGLVKLNYLLGFLHKKDGNIGKSVLHYLDAARYSEKAEYEGLSKDAVSIRKNLANLYKTYKANDLAIRYYKEAIEIADWADDKKKVISLKFNLALTYEQKEEYDDAINLFNEIFNQSSKSRKIRITNQLGSIYIKKGDLERAKSYFTDLLILDEEFKIYTAKALHNLGEIEDTNGNTNEAIELIIEAIRVKNTIDNVDQRSLFISYQVLGDYLFKTEQFDESLNAYKSAEKLVSAVMHEASSFEIYRSLSQLNYEFGKTSEARAYSSLYNLRVDQYLASQQSLQETDRQYNMDLITKRYQDQVDKQEQIASILFYSKTISGSLLALLLLTVGYNRYQQVRLRKSITQELINLKVVK